MKKRFIYFIASVTIVLTYCNETPTQTEFDEEVKLSGYVFDVFENDTLPVPEVEVLINGDVFYTNEYGSFSLDSLTFDTYSIRINSIDHHPFDTSIVINDTSAITLNLKLAPQILDIMPLKVGNIWIYEVYNFESTYSPSYDDDQSTQITEYGVRERKVVDSREIEQAFLFDVHQRYDGYEVNNIDGDTTFKNTESKSTWIVKKSTSEIFVSSKDFSEFQHSDLDQQGLLVFDINIVTATSQSNWDYFTFRRFVPRSRIGIHGEMESRIFTDDPFSIAIDTGIVSYEYSWYGHTGSGVNKYNLTSFVDN